MSTKASVGSRLETTTAFIKEMISDIQKGEIKIPQFQRKFVWKEPQALALLDSISNNYPAGSVLLWRTHNKLAVEQNIGFLNCRRPTAILQLTTCLMVNNASPLFTPV